MSDDSISTKVRTPAGVLDFQEYFVARHQQDRVDGLEFAGADNARSAPGVLDAIAEADLIVLCPSNPLVSIGPVLAVPGPRRAMPPPHARVFALPPLFPGRAQKGPADRMMTSMGYEANAAGVAAMYA